MAAGPSSSSASTGLRGKLLGFLSSNDGKLPARDVQSRPISDAELEVDYWQCVRVSIIVHGHGLTVIAVYVCQP